MNYPMYSNQFQFQELQNMRDRIDNQLRSLQQNQVQPQPITQNFQLAPNPINNELESKYADNINEVRNTFVTKTGIFVNKDYSVIWVKDINGNIRTFNTVEVVEMDEKDKEIFNLKKQIEEMKGMIKHESNSTNITDVNEQVTSKKSSRVPSGSRLNEK